MSWASNANSNQVAGTAFDNFASNNKSMEHSRDSMHHLNQWISGEDKIAVLMKHAPN